MNKADARKEVRQRLSAADIAERALWDGEIARHCRGVLDKENCGAVCIYNALPQEAATRSIIDYALDKGIKVYLPVVRGDDMYLVRASEDTRYVNGAYGISEPEGEELAPEQLKIDIVFTPMLAFTDAMGRIGKGKGYYDRFFLRCNGAKRIGIAYSIQYVQGVDMQAHDVRMQKIITEKGISD
ncbi:MAG: 5-formyltetrahydrofolate cyclo-ligase [Clostridia bacterium]|nr:5-formyltetrahydrofolate cyclo-ligase [Clostridia bacterium]